MSDFELIKALIGETVTEDDLKGDKANAYRIFDRNKNRKI